MIVSEFVKKHVPDKLRKHFKEEMEKWDNSLIGLPFSYYPSYDEDVLKMALKHAKERYPYE